MKIIEIKCPSCRAALKVNKDLDIVTCTYCGNTIKIEDENESKAERIIKSVGRQIDKRREYINSAEYKERIEKKKKEDMKLIKGFYLIGLPAFIIFLTVIFVIASCTERNAKELSLKCNVKEKQYYLTFKLDDKINCASCSEEMLEELNNKYYDSKSIKNTKENIKTYFNNLEGVCNH